MRMIGENQSIAVASGSLDGSACVKRFMVLTNLGFCFRSAGWTREDLSVGLRERYFNRVVFDSGRSRPVRGTQNFKIQSNTRAREGRVSLVGWV